ncbi:hypothetical protein [Streptomyces antibioticus]
MVVDADEPIAESTADLLDPTQPSLPHHQRDPPTPVELPDDLLVRHGLSS